MKEFSRYILGQYFNVWSWLLNEVVSYLKLKSEKVISVREIENSGLVTIMFVRIPAIEKRNNDPRNLPDVNLIYQ